MRNVTVEEHPLGITWVMEEPMRRACHALVDKGRVWIVDPVADEAALARAAELGEPQAVLQLLDRHNRHCEAVAERLGVPLLRVPDSVPGSPFEAIPALRGPLWQETALWWPQRKALIVAEVVGTSKLYTAGKAQVGMHIMLRPRPPGTLRGYRPEHLLVGHGPGVHGPDAAAGLEEAYARARRDLPHALRAAPGALKG